MTVYANTLYGGNTPQTEPQFGKTQVKNAAGGYVYALDKWKVLDRFLIIGCESNSFYTSSQKLTRENAENVLKLIAEDGIRVIDTVIDISDKGRAVKNDSAIFVLALCAAFGNDKVRKYAFDNLQKVVRIGTHLFQFVDDINKMRGWGRGLRKAVGNWYNDKKTSELVYQLIKYKNRTGWSHKDTMTLAHPTPANADNEYIFNKIVKGYAEDFKFNLTGNYEIDKFNIGMNFDKFVNDNVADACELITNYSLPREVVSTTMLNSPKIWGTLLEAGMPLTAMIRNLGNMSKCGLLTPMSDAEIYITNRLGSADYIHKSRIHPLTALAAYLTYNSGQGVRGNNTWEVNTRVANALEEAFYLSFDNVEPTGKRFLNSLDVSGSMTSPIPSHEYISSMMAMACMSMCLVRSEPIVYTGVFSKGYQLIDLSKNARLTEIYKTFSQFPFERTDCAQPMIYALKNNIKVDVFFIGTDNETWSGRIHPDEALVRYRDEMGIDAKLVTAATSSTATSISNPNYDFMLDVVGFDTAWPQIIKEFALGNI